MRSKKMVDESARRNREDGFEHVSHIVRRVMEKWSVEAEGHRWMPVHSARVATTKALLAAVREHLDLIDREEELDLALALLTEVEGGLEVERKRVREEAETRVSAPPPQLELV